MAVFLQFRIAVAGQHLTMGVDVDAFAFGLLQDDLQVLEVMAGNQNGLAFFGAQRHRGRHRVAVGAGIAGIQQFHGPQVHFAALEGQAHVIVGTQAVVQGGGHGLVNIGRNLGSSSWPRIRAWSA
jgi:hypothetical protein